LTAEEIKARRHRYIKENNPSKKPALKSLNVYPEVGPVQPLPGVSYLTTSATYYELQAARQQQSPNEKKKPFKRGVIRNNRRQLTEERIASNIM
jgi:hypothetical protein